jgi:hypothetical protein
MDLGIPEGLVPLGGAGGEQKAPRLVWNCLYGFGNSMGLVPKEEKRKLKRKNDGS